MKINLLKCDHCEKEQKANECWPRTNVIKGMITLEFPPMDPIANHADARRFTQERYDLCSPECLAQFTAARISGQNVRGGGTAAQDPENKETAERRLPRMTCCASSFLDEGSCDDTESASGAGRGVNDVVDPTSCSASSESPTNTEK